MHGRGPWLSWSPVLLKHGRGGGQREDLGFVKEFMAIFFAYFVSFGLWLSFSAIVIETEKPKTFKAQ